MVNVTDGAIIDLDQSIGYYRISGKSEGVCLLCSHGALAICSPSARAVAPIGKRVKSSPEPIDSYCDWHPPIGNCFDP